MKSKKQIYITQVISNFHRNHEHTPCQEEHEDPNLDNRPIVYMYWS